MAITSHILSSVHPKSLNARSNHFDNLLEHLQTFSYQLLAARSTLCLCLPHYSGPPQSCSTRAPIQPLFHGWQKMPLDSQLPPHQWQEMTMRPPLTWEELPVWKSFSAFQHVMGLDISGQTLDRNKMWICLMHSLHFNLNTRLWVAMLFQWEL